MVTIIVEFIGILLALILYKISGNLYTDYKGTWNNKTFPEEYKLQRPRWVVILLFIISVIPIVNIILFIFALGFIVFNIVDCSLYFHSESKIIKWLTKDI